MFLTKFFPLVTKTLVRHYVRTLLTVSGAAVGLFVFTFLGSIQAGLDSLFHQKQSEQTLVVFQAHKFCPATSRLPQDYDARIREVEGVRDVMPIQVFTNNCRASLDVVVFYGVPPEKLSDFRTFETVAGNLAEFDQHQDAALVGRAVASRRGIEPGTKFSMGDHTVSVVGVFASDNPSEENYIYAHLDFLQRKRGDHSVGTVTQHEVLLTEGADPEKVSRAIDRELRSGPVATETRPKAAFQAKSLGDLTQILSLTRYLGYACVGLALMLVSTTTVMATQDRIKEHAVMQTLGYSPMAVFSLVLLESGLQAILGGMIGVAAAMTLLLLTDLAVGVEAATIAFTPSVELALTGLAVALGVGVVAGAPSAVKAARTEIVPALREP